MEMRGIVRPSEVRPDDRQVTPVARRSHATNDPGGSIDADCAAWERLNDRYLDLPRSIAPAGGPVRCRLTSRTAGKEVAGTVEQIPCRSAQRERQDEYRDETMHLHVV